MRDRSSYSNRPPISLKDEMASVVTDCMTEKGCPDWEGWDDYLNSKVGREWVAMIASNAQDVATDHMDEAEERAKEKIEGVFERMKE